MPADDWDSPHAETDEEIDDPDLLAQVEKYVKLLPDLPYQRKGATAPGSEERSAPPRGKAEDPPPDVGEFPYCGRQAEPSDDGIYDLDLLEKAEGYVRLLPDGLFRGGERPRMPVVARGAQATDEVPAKDEDEEPEPVGSECPACGRQAQKGWTRCPWCGAALGLELSR